MNNFMSTLWQVVAITFLIILTLFLFSLLIEYVKMLWARHKFTKSIEKAIKLSDTDADKIKEILGNAMQESGIEIAEDVKIACIDDKKNK